MKLILSFAGLPVEYTARTFSWSANTLSDIVKNCCIGYCIQASCIFCIEIRVKMPFAYPNDYGMVINKKYNDLLNGFISDLEHEGVLVNSRQFYYEKVFTEAEKQAIEEKFNKLVGENFELDWVWEQWGMKNGEPPRQFRQKGLIKDSPYFKF